MYAFAWQIYGDFRLGVPHREELIRKLRTGRVEEGRWTGDLSQPVVSLPRSSNRTCPFRASGFPTDFTNSSRKSLKMQVAQTQHPQVPEHNRVREAGGSARRHLVATPQEVPHAFIHVMVDRSICHQSRSVSEVVRPPTQNSVELISHLRP